MPTTIVTRSYTPPTIPVTPSKRINEFLQARCNKYFYNTIKYVIARYECCVLAICVRVYNALSDDRRPSRVRWMIACVLVGAVLAVFTWYAIIFNTLYYVWVWVTGPVGSYLFYNVCDYGCLLLGAVGVGLIVISIIAY